MLHALDALHRSLAIGLVAMAILLGLLGTINFVTRRRLSGGFRSGYLLMIALVAVQGLLGAGALAGGARPRVILHLVYGIFAIAFLPGLYVYTRNKRADTEAAVLATACWVVVIAFFRGISTGG